MGAALTIFRLYALRGREHSHLLVKAVREQYPNASQSAEDEAVTKVAAHFDEIVATQRRTLGFTASTMIGEWQDGLPQGDVFYSDQPGGPITIWYATESRYGRYFVFGIATTEAEFWNNLEQLHADGDLWGFSEFNRPAKTASVWFVA